MDCKVVQDNAPCHKSLHTMAFMHTMGIRLACFPPNSPDFNPIEYLWRDLKRFISRQNPRNIQDLKLTIQEFLQNDVTITYCNKLIDAARINIYRSTDGLNHEGNNPTNRLYH
uniref:Tc1-like transposase DDE domain-containing protein n=1 Tax=Panagrolaimus superbus TaxID=310955 RepID=A0A914Z5T6_9BILA